MVHWISNCNERVVGEVVLIDLFSGVGGFHKGLEEAGFHFNQVYFSEIDKHSVAVYKYNFPNAEYIGSVVDVSGHDIRKKHPGARIIISFGWPCQDNSIAGKRKGQSGGARSSLLFQAVRIIQEVQPDYFIAENVKGLYSVNDGVDFIESLRVLSYLYTDSFQYNVEHQLLNTSWIIPQNRERTYFVGYPANRGCRQILPIKHSDLTDLQEKARRDLRERVQAGKDGLPGQYRETGTDIDFNVREQKHACNTYTDRKGRIIKNNARALTGSGKAAGDNSDSTLVYDQKAVVNNKGHLEYRDKASSIDANYAKGMDNSCQRTHIETKVTQINPNKESGGKQPYQHNRVYDPKGLSPTLDVDKRSPIVPVDVGTWRTHKDDAGLREIKSGLCPTIPTRQREEGSGQPVIRHRAVLTPERGEKRQNGRRFKEEEEEMFTLSCQDRHGVEELTSKSIRRLTENECERLQGFPDDWTKYGNYHGTMKEVSSSQRYKQMGNAVTTWVVALVGQKIKEKWTK